LPEIFRAKGYKTIAVTSGGTVAGVLGFCKGFDVFKETPLLECLDQLENWLRTNQNRKFFMFLHTMRVHAPYIDLTYADEVMTDAEIDELEGLTSGMLKSLSKAIFLTMRNAKGVIAAQREKLKEMGLYTKEVTEALYDGGINKTDGYIGELIEVLKRTGVLDNTIIVLTSDHGEEFGDHNPRYFYDFHGRSLYEEMVRVPLIFVVPGNFPQGKRINFQVRLIDIMPTLLGLNRIEYDASRVQGVSLVPIIQGKGMENELVAISEALGLGPESKSIRTNKAKYIYTVKSGNLTNGERTLVAHNPDKEELYDLLHDPGEKNNIKQLEPHLSAVSKNKINKILENAVKALSGAKKEKRIKVDEQMKNRLKALGYIE
jgi:arylsulfatase A-like enzyme